MVARAQGNSDRLVTIATPAPRPAETSQTSEYAGANNKPALPAKSERPQQNPKWMTTEPEG